MTKTKEILDTAAKLTGGDRHNTYGDKRKNFQNIADLWNAYQQNRTITAKDVGVLMGLLKVARTMLGQGTSDNYVDAVGYLALAGELDTDVRENSGTVGLTLSDIGRSYVISDEVFAIDPSEPLGSPRCATAANLYGKNKTPGK